MTYSTLGGRKEWQERNRFYALIMAIILTLAAVGLTIMYARGEREPPRHGGPQEVKAGPEEARPRRVE